MTNPILLHRTDDFISPKPPLFLPLNKKWYWQFVFGEKRHELRKYGARWNESTCMPGRRVTLSLGYGKWHRCMGVITEFRKQRATTLDSTQAAAIMEVYGVLDLWMACFEIKLDEVGNAIVPEEGARFITASREAIEQ